jgi:REP element-mobilizing transposase RayT
MNSLAYCQKQKGLEVSAYCLMTNHLHIIACAKEGYKLSEIVRDFKAFTSRQMRKALEENTRESRRNWMLWIFRQAGLKNKRNKGFQFWRQDNHPVALVTPEMVSQRLSYTHENPVRAGFVPEPEAWCWSSARDYAGIEKSPLELYYLR